MMIAVQLSRRYVIIALVLICSSFASGCFDTYAQSEQLESIEKLETISDIKLDPLKLNQIINFDSLHFINEMKTSKTDHKPPVSAQVSQPSASLWQLKGTFIMSEFQIAWLDLGSNQVYELSVGDMLPGQSWFVSRIFPDRVELSSMPDCSVSPECDETLQLWMSSRLY